MSAYGYAIEAFFKFSLYILAPLSLLGLWKLIEILMWIWRHTTISWS